MNHRWLDSRGGGVTEPIALYPGINQGVEVPGIDSRWMGCQGVTELITLHPGINHRGGGTEPITLHQSIVNRQGVVTLYPVIFFCGFTAKVTKCISC